MKEINEDKKDYLAMIQEPIGRMSTASSVFKGFSATIVTGIAALSYAELKTIILILSFLPILAFWALDIYYLQIEKKYRGLYDDVLNGKHPVDYSMRIPKDQEFKKRAKASIGECMKSPSILLFYPAMFLVLIIICFLNMGGVL